MPGTHWLTRNSSWGVFVSEIKYSLDSQGKSLISSILPTVSLYFETGGQSRCFQTSNMLKVRWQLRADGDTTATLYSSKPFLPRKKTVRVWFYSLYPVSQESLRMCQQKKVRAEPKRKPSKEKKSLDIISFPFYLLRCENSKKLL